MCLAIKASVDFPYGASDMDRNVLNQRITRLTTLQNSGVVFRNGLATYERAKAFATKAHMGQMYGNKPSTYHLEQVENVLIRFDYCSFRMRTAAWLHDTVENCDATMEDIKREFPGFVASVVDAITSVPGENREQCNSAMYLRIKERGTNAVVLKLADRIANVEETILTGDNTFSVCHEEYSGFRNALYESKNADEMWAHMDALNEIGTEALNRRHLTAFANSISSCNQASMLQIDGVS